MNDDPYIKTLFQTCLVDSRQLEPSREIEKGSNYYIRSSSFQEFRTNDEK